MRVAVLAGGRSAEREVSLRSGAQVGGALREAGHEPELVDLDEHTWDVLRDGRFDVVFIALHGRFGEDGTVQGMLELLGIPYTGCGVLASALCLDKPLASRLLRDEGFAIPDFIEVDGDEARTGLPPEVESGSLGWPLVVKPAREGSTIGLTIAANADAAADGIRLAAGYDRRVVCQRFVAGVEVTLGVLQAPELEVLPSLEIVSENPVYDYEAKYTEGRSRHIIPARIPAEAREACADVAARAFQLFGCDGMARVDLIVDEQQVPWVLEVNTVPGLTELSLLPDAARAAGIQFPDLCDRLVRHGAGRFERRL
ncbi:MAG TPA: D-alanine--D-alanine ligase [Candidatus Dormibacteraeota bacterium]